MHVYRCAYRLVLGLGCLFTIAFIVSGLSACSTTGASLTPARTTKLPTPATASLSTPVETLVVTSLPNTTAWKTYRSDRAGYTVEYPADWKINERIESDGADVTTFVPSSPSSDGIELTVIVRNGTSTSEEIPDMPNTRCQQVMVGKLSGTRCFDTIAFSTTTTLMGQGKVYILASSGKRFDQNIYQHFLDSFAPTA